MADAPKSAQSFNANGSTVVSFEQVGDAVNTVDIGVGVIGTQCGVHGECVGFSRGTREAPRGTGIHGRGPLIGVNGEAQISDARLGPQDATGVLGQGYKQSPGTIGICYKTDTPHILGDAAGVIGASNGDSTRRGIAGAGVVGMSFKNLGLADIPVLPNPNDLPDGDGTGVWGVSGSGTGVHGESQTGRGGVLQSEQSAQLRLIPSRTTPVGTERAPISPRELSGQSRPRLPRDGQAGDLMAIVDNQDQATLWFCVRSKIEPDGSAHWAQVLLGEEFEPLR